MQKTYLACLTPSGRGAIATLALRGPNAWTLVRDLVTLPATSRQLPAEPRVGHLWLGHVGDKAHGRDEVVVTAKPGQGVELHCHGGAEVVRMLQGLFSARGAVACSWVEFDSLAADDPLSAQATVELAQASTMRTAGILLDQSQGALNAALIDMQTAIASGNRDVALQSVDQLLRYANVGLHLTRPWSVAIAGAPNVGKSTLINALAGFQRSIVSAIPGTTRDVVTVLAAIDGWPVELADTAGWRESQDSMEREGIERGAASAREADLCLWVLDASEPPVWPAEARFTHWAINKIDLPSAWDLEQHPQAVRVSAKTGEGIDGLLASISHWLVPDAPPPGAPVPFSRNVVSALREARERLVENQLDAADRILRRMLGSER